MKRKIPEQDLKLMYSHAEKFFELAYDAGYKEGKRAAYEEMKEKLDKM